ncbi:mRNA surveillance protein pelota [Methanohalophilus sp.]|uniref:mRNA surveillance protein pelota n=1 Tax=Methanohalophilus sp. TaxID=1966352 RepID=UPI0026158AC6|nr:mRNA surveillance protein pelota [Methanohalophilus sp.]MDK2892573.1 protein pelota [Methanohalophilus sp.]
MRVLKKNLKGNEGEITLVPQTLDDLWHLKYIIEPGDLVFALTKRKVDSATDKLRPEKSEKKTVRLGILVESLEFHKFSNRLRLHGPIEHGMDEGSYHTLNIEQGNDISIVKVWKGDQLERIEEAEAAAKRPKVIIVAVEEGDADIGFVRHYGIELYAHVRQSSGKGEGSLREDFFETLLEKLKYPLTGEESIVLAGPGFTKEDFLNYVKTREPELASRILIEDTSSIGMSGFQEVLRRGAVDRLVEQSRLSREAALMDELLKEISIDGKAAYGMEEVCKAQDYGAIETLLVADEYLRQEREEGSIDSFIRNVEYSKGKLVVLSTEFEPGQKLAALGGIAAILRFRI